MRAFLAFEVADEVTERLLATEEELKKTGVDLSPVGRENIHFTVKFLGDIPDSATEEIDQRIKRLKLRAIELDVRGVGAFPNPGRPRVVWAGVADEDEAEIRGLSESVIGALEGIGKSEDHEFHAHITLARVRSPHNGQVLASFIQMNRALDFGRTRIDSLKLKSSALTPRGPIYSDVREYAFS
jgi:RNA 2',3'-cyclic 3'-phosphodiesterase